jgi:hypothetical protein
VERNSLRANLVGNAQDWRWSSLWTGPDRRSTIGLLLSRWPVERPARWTTMVNRPHTEAELAALVAPAIAASRTAMGLGRSERPRHWESKAPCLRPAAEKEATDQNGL